MYTNHILLRVLKQCQIQEANNNNSNYNDSELEHNYQTAQYSKWCLPEEKQSDAITLASDAITHSLVPWPTKAISLSAQPAVLNCDTSKTLHNASSKNNNYNSTLSNAPDKQRFKQKEQLQLNNETHTINTNCHRSYSFYCDEYMFDTAKANNGFTCTSWTPTEHTFIKSQSQQRISHIPVNVQSTCSTICNQLALCNSILLAIYLHTICNPLAHLWLNSTCNLLAHNLQSTCSFVTQFYLQSTCTQFAINLLFAALQLEVAFKLPAIYNQLALCSTTTSTGIQIACNLQSVALCLQLQLAFKLPAIYNQLALCSTTISTGIQTAYNLQSVALCLQLQLA